ACLMPNSSTSQLQVLIDRMNAGEADAHNELINHAAERLRKLTRKMLHQDFKRLRRWEGTGDILNNAVLRLMRALQAVPPITTKEFFQLATRHIRWELRDLARHYRDNLSADGPMKGKRASDERPAREVSTTSGNPSRLAAWTEFHSAVDALPEGERDVFDLLW